MSSKVKKIQAWIDGKQIDSIKHVEMQMGFDYCNDALQIDDEIMIYLKDDITYSFDESELHRCEIHIENMDRTTIYYRLPKCEITTFQKIIKVWDIKTQPFEVGEE